MPDNVRVWDLFVRVFHWSLVSTVFIALVTEDDFLNLHIVAGYAVGILIIARILWGLIGPKYARFSNFIYSPKAVMSYLGDLKNNISARYLGHSPAGGAMIIVLMITLLLTTISGLSIYAKPGSVFYFFVVQNAFFADIIKDAHEVLAGTLWVLITLHVAGVIYTSLIHRENLVRAMITGLKRNN